MTTDTVRPAPSFPPSHLPLRSRPPPHPASQALGVTSLVASGGKTLSTIPFVDHPTISFGPHEGVEMPFRYVVDDQSGEPILPQGMREHLKCVGGPSLCPYERMGVWLRTRSRGLTALTLSPRGAGPTWIAAWTTSDLSNADLHKKERPNPCSIDAAAASALGRQSGRGAGRGCNVPFAFPSSHRQRSRSRPLGPLPSPGPCALVRCGGSKV